MSTKPDPQADPWSHVVTLAAGLVHEIKNPLSTISLNLQLLLEDWQRDAATPRERRSLKRLETLQRETGRLTGLLEDFLRYARPLHVSPEACRLNPLVQELLDFIAPKATQLHIQVRSTLAPDLPVIQADPKLLKQALLNLLLNAQEAMPQGGELIVQTSLVESSQSGFARLRTLKTKPSSPGFGLSAQAPAQAAKETELIEPTAEPLGSTRCAQPHESAAAPVVQIDITDTGVGIPDHQLGKIFDLYFTTKATGSGLGLCTTRRILDLHGGSIAVESEVGKGTHFTVRLPSAPPAPQAEGAPP